jgi:hypothetical protein
MTRKAIGFLINNSKKPRAQRALGSGYAMNQIYWKEEPQQRAWKLIPDIQTEIEKAIQAGAMYKTWTSFSSNPGNGKEVTRFGDFPLDFDSKDPEKALNDMRTLCLTHLPDMFDLDPYCVEFYCSGSKGFHAVIPAACFSSEAGDVYLPLIYKKVAAMLKEIFSLETLDLSLYNMKKGKMFRLANVKRSNGRYKVPLTLEEVRDLSFDELWDLSKEARQVDQVDTDTDCELSDLYEQMRKEVYSEIKDHDQAEPFKGEVKGVLPCVSHILETRPNNDRVNFNKLVMVLINYYQMINVSKEDVGASVGDFLKRYEHSATYDTGQKRVAHWRSQWSYLKDNEDYYFSCAFMKSLLPGFDCSACEGKEEPEDPKDETILTPLAEILNMHIDFEPPIIDGLLDDRDSLLLTGDSGLGKSLCVNTIALHVAAGAKLFEQFEISSPQNILLIQSENSLKATKRRLKAMMGIYDRKVFHDALYRILTPMRGMDCRMSGDLLKKSFQDKLTDMITTANARLVILDPLVSYHTEEENSNVAMRSVLDALTEIASAAGAATIVVHHHGKSEHVGANQARGASSIKDWARGCLTLNKQKHETKTLVKVTHTKHGNFPQAKGFLFEVDGPAIRVVEADVICPPARVAELLKTHGGAITSKNAFIEILIEECDISRRTAALAIDETESFGFIEKRDKGRSHEYRLQ